jgi:hypothetical protein
MSRTRRHAIAAIAIALVASGQLLAAPMAQAATTTMVIDGPARCC